MESKERKERCCTTPAPVSVHPLCPYPSELSASVSCSASLLSPVPAGREPKAAQAPGSESLALPRQTHRLLLKT